MQVLDKSAVGKSFFAQDSFIEEGSWKKQKIGHLPKILPS